jgi:mRNA interferase HicA
MKRRDLVQHLKAKGCVPLREGAKHAIFHNPAQNVTSSVPRHTEINDFLARKICRDLRIPLPHEK